MKTNRRTLIGATLAVAATVMPVAACGSTSATHSTASSAAGATSSVAAPSARSSPAAPTSLAAPVCPLTVEAVEAAIGTVFRGPVKLEAIPGAVECTYQVEDNRWLHVRVTPYTANRKATIVINQTTVEYGGTSAQQVFTSAAAAFQKVAQAGSDRGFEQYPDIGAGLVTDAGGGFVLAGTRDVWYSGDFGIFTNRDYNVVAMNVAKALAAL
jgi:hypothetical protein